MKTGKGLANVFATIGTAFSLVPMQTRKRETMKIVSDKDAISSAWEEVGKDLRDVMGIGGEEDENVKGRH